jgi:hypothetical protein
MTEAKRANWYSEGEKAERKMDDFELPDRIAGDSAGAAAEETLETGLLDDFFLLAIFSSSFPLSGL